MNCKRCTLMAVALVAGGAWLTSAGAEGDQTSLGPATPIQIPSPQQNPILMYDVTGGTLAGVIHLRLTVYDSGQASISEAGFTVPNDDSSDGRAAFTFVGPDVADQLRHDLIAAGAGEITGGPGNVSDVPLQTITFFRRPAPQSKANTFTFLLATGQIGDVLQVINAFIDEYFPGF